MIPTEGNYIHDCEIKLADSLRKTFQEIDKGSIQVGEDEYHVYFFNKKHECWTTKSKHGMRMRGEKLI